MSRFDYGAYCVVFSIHVPFCAWLAHDAASKGVTWACWLNIGTGALALIFAVWSFACWRKA